MTGMPSRPRKGTQPRFLNVTLSPPDWSFDTANLFANSSFLFLGNSGINVQVNSSTINVGANASINTTVLFVGNSTIFSYMFAGLIEVVNSTSTLFLQPTQVVTGNSVLNTTAYAVGNSTFYLLANQTPFLQLANSVQQTNVTADGIKVGANTIANAAGFFGNGAGLTSVSGTPPTINVVTSTVTYSSPAGCKLLKITCVGGGGAGGNSAASGGNGAGAGGGGGGCAILYLAAPVSGVTVTVGAGGTAAGTQTGGTSSFGASCSATGGGVGQASNTVSSASPSAGGTAGTGTGGNINLNGGPGITTVGRSWLGTGGFSIFGWGGLPGLVLAANVGQPGPVYGAGGGGSTIAGSINGGSGNSGIVIIEEFYG